jgi:hypothetical protein
MVVGSRLGLRVLGVERRKQRRRAQADWDALGNRRATGPSKSNGPTCRTMRPVVVELHIELSFNFWVCGGSPLVVVRAHWPALRA